MVVWALQENVDNDDGSRYYKTHDNFFVYGGRGMKNDFGECSVSAEIAWCEDTGCALHFIHRARVCLGSLVWTWTCVLCATGCGPAKFN